MIIENFDDFYDQEKKPSQDAVFPQLLCLDSSYQAKIADLEPE